MKRVRNVFLCLALLFASVAGMPVTPDEIEELLKDMSQPKVVQQDQEGATTARPPDPFQ